VQVDHFSAIAGSTDAHYPDLPTAAIGGTRVYWAINNGKVEAFLGYQFIRKTKECPLTITNKSAQYTFHYPCRCAYERSLSKYSNIVVEQNAGKAAIPYQYQKFTPGCYIIANECHIIWKESGSKSYTQRERKTTCNYVPISQIVPGSSCLGVVLISRSICC
jgi:hypothetical protein